MKPTPEQIAKLEKQYARFQKKRVNDVVKKWGFISGVKMQEIRKEFLTKKGINL